MSALFPPQWMAQRHAQLEVPCRAEQPWANHPLSFLQEAVNITICHLAVPTSPASVSLPHCPGMHLHLISCFLEPGPGHLS